MNAFLGDLAEMLIIQKPIIKQYYFFGLGGNWNDTRLPINYYFNVDNEVIDRELWQFTDAEIIGAIDGSHYFNNINNRHNNLIYLVSTYIIAGMRLAHEASRWSQSRRILRLSQLLESYYTNKCTSHLHAAHASKRKFIFSEIMKSSGKFIEQVSRQKKFF